MACTLISSGISKACAPNQGGVQKLYLTDYDNLLGITSANGLISAISMASATNFYEYEFNRDTAEMQDNTTINIQNGTTYQAQVVSLTIPRREVSKRNNLKLLTNKKLAVIALDFNGIYWLLGETNGMLLSEMTSTSGKAAGDLNGYVISLNGQEPNMAQEVDSSLIPGLI